MWMSNAPNGSSINITLGFEARTRAIATVASSRQITPWAALGKFDSPTTH